MAMSLTPSEAKTMERRQRVILELPPDFLRLPNHVPICPPPNLSQQQIERIDEQTAYALHQQLNAGTRGVPQGGITPGHIRGRLLISVMQAKLMKNYGLSRMDPYCRLHIGHQIYETPTAVNGAKNPRWNKTIQCFLPVGIQQIYLEIYDECSFSVDELVAHATIQIPEEIFTNGETVENWYNLSGKQGDEKEGQILLVFSFMATPAGSMAPPTMAYIQSTHGRGGSGKKQHPVYSSGLPVQTALAPPVTVPTFSEDDFTVLKEMFPNLDEEVVKSVYESSGFSKDSAANALLSMTD